MCVFSLLACQNTVPVHGLLKTNISHDSGADWLLRGPFWLCKARLQHTCLIPSSPILNPSLGNPEAHWKTCGQLADFPPNPNPIQLWWLALPIQKNLRRSQGNILSSSEISMASQYHWRAESVFPDETFSSVNAAYLAKTPILHVLEHRTAVQPSTQKVCCKNQPPQQRQRSVGSNDTLWIYVPPW